MTFLSRVRDIMTAPVGSIFSSDRAAEPARDEFGRTNEPTKAPEIGVAYVPRVRDRRSEYEPPWTPEMILAAHQAAEQGDMTAQATLEEYMEEKDGALGGFMRDRRGAPCGLKWSIEPANDSPLAERAAELCRTEIKGIPNFEHGRRDATDAIGKGTSALWIDWRKGGRSADTNYRIQGLHHISPKRYRFHWSEERFLVLPDEALAGPGMPAPPQFGQGGRVMLAGGSQGVEPAPWKVILHLTRLKSGHPAKAGCGRMVALYWMLRNLMLKDAAIYCEAFGFPARVGKYPDGMSDEEKALFREALDLYGTEAVAIVSKAVDIEYQEVVGGKGGTPFLDVHKECERQMELAILGQEQTNTANKFGTQGQTQAGGAKVRQDLLEADCIDLQTTFTWQLCYPIVGFSNLEQPYTDPDTGKIVWPVANEVCPRFKLHYEPESDRESEMAIDVPLITVFGFKQTHGQLAKRYKRELPPGVDPNEIVEPRVAAPPAGSTPPPANDESGGRRRRRSVAQELTDAIVFAASGAHRGQSAVDKLNDRAAEEIPDAIEQLAAPIRTIFREAKSLPDALTRLQNAFPELDASEFEKLVRRNAFTSRLYGRQTAVRTKEE